MDLLLGIVLGLLGFSALYLADKAGYFVKLFERKTGIDVDNPQIEKAIRDAIFYAEEKAAQYIKENKGKLSSSDKLEMAVNYVKDISGLELTPNKIAMMIEAKLAQIADVGATKEKFNRRLSNV